MQTDCPFVSYLFNSLIERHGQYPLFGLFALAVGHAGLVGDQQLLVRYVGAFEVGVVQRRGVAALLLDEIGHVQEAVEQDEG